MSYPHFNNKGRFSIISKQSASFTVQMEFDTDNVAGYTWAIGIEKIADPKIEGFATTPYTMTIPASVVDYNESLVIDSIYELNGTLIETLKTDQLYKISVGVAFEEEIVGTLELYATTRPLQEPELSVVETNFTSFEFDVFYGFASNQIYENSYMRVRVFNESNTLILTDEFVAYPTGTKNFVISTLTPSHQYKVEVTNILKSFVKGEPYTYVITNDKIYDSGVLVTDTHGFATDKREVGLGDYKYTIEYEVDNIPISGNLVIQLNAFNSSDTYLGLSQFTTTTPLGEHEFDLNSATWKDDIEYLAFSIFWLEADNLVPITLNKFNLKYDNIAPVGQSRSRTPNYTISTLTPTITYVVDPEGILNNQNPTTYTTVPVTISASQVLSTYAGDWEFDGWYDNDAFTGVVVTSITDFGNYTLYAKINNITTGDATVPIIQLVSRLTTELTLSFKVGVPYVGTYLGFGVQFDIGEDDAETDTTLLFPDVDALEHIEIISPAIDLENVMIFDGLTDELTYRFTGLDADTTYKVITRTIFFGTVPAYSIWSTTEFDTLVVNPEVHKPPIVNLVSVTTDTLVLEFDYNNPIFAGSKIVVIGSNLVTTPFDINFSSRIIESRIFDELDSDTEYQIICSSARNVGTPLMSEVVTYNFKTLLEDVVVNENYKILIGGEDYTNKVSHGFSWHEKITYDLNEGSIRIPFSSINTPFPMFTIVDILKEDGTYLFSGRIAHDYVSVNSKRGRSGIPQIYSHDIHLIEHTKLLERYWISGKTFTQPTGRAKITYNNYTLLNVVEILRDTVPMRLLGEMLEGQEPSDYTDVNDLTMADDVNVFRLTPNVMAILNSIEAPEFNFKEINLREALNEVFSVIDAVPYLTRDRFLEFRYFNFLGNQILDIRNTKEDREQDITEYATTLVSNAVNTIANDRQLQHATHGNESYPEQGMFVGLRSRDFIFNFDSSYIPTPKPIYDIKQVYAKTKFTITKTNVIDGTDKIEVSDFFTVNISDRVVEKNIYDLLEQIDEQLIIGRLRKNSVFTYNYGQPNIDTSHTFGIFNTLTAIQNVMVLGFISSYRGQTIGSGGSVISLPFTMNKSGFNLNEIVGEVTKKYRYNVIVEPLFGGVDYFDYSFRTEYLSLPDEIRMEIDREDTSEISLYSELITNQKARLIDSTRYMNNMFFNINKKGLSNLELSHQVASIDDTFNLGDYYSDDFIITEKETIFYNGHIRALYKLNKNFNKTALFQGLNSQVRQWEIGEKGRTLTRELAYKESIIIRTTDVANRGSLSGIKTLLPAFVWNNIRDTFNIYDGLPNSVTHCLIRTFLGDTATGQAVSERLGAYSKIAMSPQRNIGGNTVSLSFQFDDNVSAGKVISAATFLGVPQYANKVIKYTDDNGRFDTMYFEFFSGSATVSDENALAPILYPLVTPQMFNYANLAGEDSLYVKKDNREVLKFNFLYQFIAPEKELIIGQEFVERNYIFSKVGLSAIGTVGSPARDTKFKIRFYYGHKFRKTENGKAPQATDEQLLDCVWNSSLNRLEINNTPVGINPLTSWAIVSDDDIIFAYNGDTIKSIVFDLLGKRRDIQYRRY